MVRILDDDVGHSFTTNAGSNADILVDRGFTALI
jgi:hypothetical protein